MNNPDPNQDAIWFLSWRSTCQFKASTYKDEFQDECVCAFWISEAQGLKVPKVKHLPDRSIQCHQTWACYFDAALCFFRGISMIDLAALHERQVPLKYASRWEWYKEFECLVWNPNYNILMTAYDVVLAICAWCKVKCMCCLQEMIFRMLLCRKCYWEHPDSYVLMDCTHIHSPLRNIINISHCALVCGDWLCNASCLQMICLILDIQLFTNDIVDVCLFLSTVVNFTGQERYSIAFFYEPNAECMVECLQTCYGPDNPPRYSPTMYGTYLCEKYKATGEQYEGTTGKDADKAKK